MCIQDSNTAVNGSDQYPVVNQVFKWSRCARISGSTLFSEADAGLVDAIDPSESAGARPLDRCHCGMYTWVMWYTRINEWCHDQRFTLAEVLVIVVLEFILVYSLLTAPSVQAILQF